MTTKKSAKKQIDFDQALQCLETIVKEMEQGNLGLEQSLKKFEEGVLLANQCQKRLDSAEQHIKQLQEDPQD